MTTVCVDVTLAIQDYTKSKDLSVYYDNCIMCCSSSER